MRKKKMDAATKLIQQGDVLFYGMEKLPEGLRPKEPVHPGLVIFAVGEATGHHHSAVADDVELYVDAYGVLWCRVTADEAVVTHQEHKPVTLKRGNYRIGIVREYDPFADEARPVRD